MGVGVEFRVLGPVGVWSNGIRLPVTGTLRPALLGVLLIHANQVLTADSLIDTLWESAPPRTASTSLQVMVHRLRQTLGPEQARLSTRGSGYRLRVDDGELDLHVFHALTATARSLAMRSPLEAAAVLHRALDLWSVPILGGATSVRVLRDEAERLGDLRLAALEDRVAADLAAGRADDLVDELTEAVAARPTRERLRAQLMLALYRCQRTVDALSIYRAGRLHLVRDLGVEPGPLLQELHARMLRNDPHLMSGPDRPYPGRAFTLGQDAVRMPMAPPRLIPHDVTHFGGRDRELAMLSTVADSDRVGIESGSTPIVVLAGMPGVGKTALAVRFAHRGRSSWRDGHLYLDLHGFDPDRAPTSAAEALYQLLTALGVPASAVPTDLDARMMLYRQTLDGLRAVIILDNAADVAQVRPLLPGTPHCMVIVTSRNQLVGLAVHDGAEIHTVEPLSADDSLGLLSRVVGSVRVGAEPDAVARLVELSGGVPLALRISAAKLLAHPYEPIAAYVSLLATNPMDALQVDGDDRSVARLAFNASYRSLPAPDRHLFCLVGQAPCADLTPAAAAALVDMDVVQAAEILERLGAANLADEYVAGRWRLHDLLRSYAVDRARVDEPTDGRTGSVHLLLAHYLVETRAAVGRLLPGPSPTVHAGSTESNIHNVEDAIAWFDDERRNLVAAVEYAARHDAGPLTWQLTDAFTKLSLLRNYVHDAIDAGTAAIGAAKRAADPEGLAHIHMGLGGVYYSVGDNDTAIGHYVAGIEFAERIGWLQGQALAGANLGVIHVATGRPLQALDHYRRAILLRRDLHDPYGEAVALDNVGGISISLGDPRDALRHHRQALYLHREVAFPAGQALALANIGNALRELGDLGEALDACSESLAIYRQVGARGGEAQVLCCIADVHADAGRSDEARQAAEAGLTAATECGDERSACEALNILGTVAAAAGDLDRADTLHCRAIEAAFRIDYPVEIHGSLLGLSAVERRRGAHDNALACARRALRLARTSHHVIALPAILIELARVHRDRGAWNAALGHLVAAERMCDRSGQRLQRRTAATMYADMCAVPDDSLNPREPA